MFSLLLLHQMVAVGFEVSVSHVRLMFLPWAIDEEGVVMVIVVMLTVQIPWNEG